MKVVAPTPLLRAAAETLGPIREEVVVVGALAVEIALDGSEVGLNPTLDIDAGTEVADVEAVIGHLEGNDFARSELSWERPFTWVKGEVKVQLMRPFHPFPTPQAAALPQNNLVSELATNNWEVGFAEAPESGLFRAARPAALVALKEAAFGRERHGGEGLVDRDFSDAALVLEHHRELIRAEVAGLGALRQRVERAARRLAEDPAPAARELAAMGQVESIRAGEAMVTRIAREALQG